ncbi:hypothetical protein A0105_004443, partial [Salmonella enterica subsp. enterica serovar Worthington]|nr:hypothetical protein [Salmonella enterica subsp. enterica serovar Worthington]
MKLNLVKSLFLSPIDSGGRARALFLRANENVSAYPLFPAKRLFLSRSLLMTAPSQVLKIRRPDDWHVHLRDGDML